METKKKKTELLISNFVWKMRKGRVENEKEGSDSKQWSLLYVHGWENKALFPLPTTIKKKKRTKKKFSFFEILAWSKQWTDIHYLLQKQRPCDKTSYAHKNHPKKPIFSTSFRCKQTDQRESEQPQMNFHAMKPNNTNISKLYTSQMTKPNTPLHWNDK